MDVFGKLCGYLYRLNKSWQDAPTYQKHMFAQEEENLGGGFNGPYAEMAKEAYNSLKILAKVHPITTTETVLEIARKSGMTVDDAKSFANGFSQTYRDN